MTTVYKEKRQTDCHNNLSDDFFIRGTVGSLDRPQFENGMFIEAQKFPE